MSGVLIRSMRLPLLLLRAIALKIIIKEKCLDFVSWMSVVPQDLFPFVLRRAVPWWFHSLKAGNAVHPVLAACFKPVVLSHERAEDPFRACKSDGGPHESCVARNIWGGGEGSMLPVNKKH